MTHELATIDAPEELKTHVAACVQWSEDNTITTPAQMQATGAHLKDIKTALKRADEFFDPPIKQAYDLHKMLVGRKKVLTAPLERSEAIDKSKMLAYQRAEQEKADAENRRLQKIADEAARREREALEKRAAAAKKPETIERLKEQAASIVAPVVAVQTAAPKVEGVSVRKYWRAEVVDLPAFLAYCCENKRHDLLLPNDAILQALAKGLKQMAWIPGVKFSETESLSARV